MAHVRQKFAFGRGLQFRPIREIEQARDECGYVRYQAILSATTLNACSIEYGNARREYRHHTDQMIIDDQRITGKRHEPFAGYLNLDPRFLDHLEVGSSSVVRVV